MTSQKTYKFYWVHINTIQLLNAQELDTYAKSISMAMWPSAVTSWIMKAIDIRREELLHRVMTENHLAVCSVINEVS